MDNNLAKVAAQDLYVERKRKMKRTLEMPLQDVQENNRSWWTSNPMTYDWRGENRKEPLTLEWFDWMDSIFVHASRLFATDKTPFDRIIPFEQLNGKRVLEIGCGMGLHSELMTRAGAILTSIDLTPKAVQANKARMALKGLHWEVMQTDAEVLPFADDTFDFVWSWGVIHHSSRTGRIVRQIARVLKPQAECRLMVYNREGGEARIIFMRDYLLKFKWMKQSFDEVLHQGIDGFSARFYVMDQFEDLFRTFFKNASSRLVGQETDGVPLPRSLRRLLMPFVPESYLRNAQSKRGSYIFLTATEPEWKMK